MSEASTRPWPRARRRQRERTVGDLRGSRRPLGVARLAHRLVPRAAGGRERHSPQSARLPHGRRPAPLQNRRRPRSRCRIQATAGSPRAAREMKRALLPALADTRLDFGPEGRVLLHDGISLSFDSRRRELLPASSSPPRWGGGRGAGIEFLFDPEAGWQQSEALSLRTPPGKKPPSNARSSTQVRSWARSPEPGITCTSRP